MIGAALLLAAAIAGAGQDSVRVDGEWQRWESAHFVAFSDAPEKRVAAALRDLEALRAVLQQTSDFELQSAVPTFVYLFGTRRAFEPFRLPGLGRPETIGGYFTRREDASFMAIAGGRGADPSQTVYHEYLHDLLATNLPGCPLWLEEGLAELFQTFRLVGDEARIGLPVDEHLLLLRREGLFPLDDLLAIHRDHPVYVGGDHRGRFYAQSWALVHYLLMGAPERQGQLGRYITLLRRGTPAGAAFDAAFGSDRGALQGELLSYTRRAIFTYRAVPVARPSDTPVEHRLLTPSEALTALGDLLAAQRPANPRAGDYYRAALAAEPGDGAALAGLADLAALNADWSAAADGYRAAVRRAPGDASVQLRAGIYLLERGGDAAAAIAPLTAATELAPGLGPAWSHLASALELGAGDLAAALAAVRRAAELMPADREVLIQLVRLAAADGDAELVARTVREARLPDPDDRQRLRGTAVTSLANAATRALLDQRLDDAARLLDGARRQLEEPPASALAEIVQRVAASLAEARLAARYDAARELVAAGDLDRAVALLDEVLAAAPTDALRAACEELRARLLAPPPTPAPPPVPAITRVSPGEVAALNAAIAAGDLDRAIQLLAELDARLDRDQHSWIDVKLAELRRARQGNRFAAGYNRAVDLYNERRYAEAVAVLDQLMGQDLSSEQSAQVTSLRRRAAAGGAR